MQTKTVSVSRATVLGDASVVKVFSGVAMFKTTNSYTMLLDEHDKTIAIIPHAAGLITAVAPEGMPNATP